jgi:hypothetical protein
MVKRAIFYDDCRDASRLAAEYALQLGSMPTVYYDPTIGKFSYKWIQTATSQQYITLNSFQTSGSFEITHLFKTHNTVGAGYEGKGIMFYYSWRSNSDTYYVALWDQYYFQSPYGQNYFGAMLPGNDVWSCYKIRVNGSSVLSKIWLNGTSEPNWMWNSRTIGTGTDKPNTVRRSLGGTVGFGCLWLNAAGATHQIADIRITPIPRTGGP